MVKIGFSLYIYRKQKVYVILNILNKKLIEKQNEKK